MSERLTQRQGLCRFAFFAKHWLITSVIGVLAPLWMAAVLLERAYVRWQRDLDIEAERPLIALLYLGTALAGLTSPLWALVLWLHWQRRRALERKVGRLLCKLSRSP